eukprot:7394953-Pyramimonas_sp.AAC.1
MSQRSILSDRRFSFTSRLRFFDRTVSSSVLHGSETGVVTQDLEDKQRRTQRKMLRMILMSKRRRTTSGQEYSHASVDNVDVPDIVEDGLEPWPDWIKRTTHEAE